MTEFTALSQTSEREIVTATTTRLPETVRTARTTVLRWLKFNAVGAGGIVVQLVALAVLKSGMKVDYLVATALAVEAAVMHNYFWHQRFTWADRPARLDRTGFRDHPGDPKPSGRLRRRSLVRFAKFNLTTGLFSIAGNILLMRVLVGGVHLNYFAANIFTIATCSIINFLVSDRFVFQES
jgi:putative flippase GtrA